MEEKARERITRRTSKYVAGIIQAVVGKNNFLVQFKDGKKREDVSRKIM